MTASSRFHGDCFTAAFISFQEERMLHTKYFMSVSRRRERLECLGAGSVRQNRELETRAARIAFPSGEEVQSAQSAYLRTINTTKQHVDGFCFVVSRDGALANNLAANVA